MIPRHQLVQSMLEKLQEASECVGLNHLIKTAFEFKSMLSSFSLPSYSGRQLQEELEVDRVAKNLYPEDAPRNMLPFICKGDGNHLFEAASVLLWGNTSLTLELQVRTVVEMLLHKQYYFNGMIDSKVMLQAARYSLCTDKNPQMTKLPLATIEAIFDVDIKASCFPGSYVNMWHVYALASVLQCNIYSIYPMSNLKIRPYFNRLIRPRTCHLQTSTLHIMWSGKQVSSQVFEAQYFVPVMGLEELEPAASVPEPQVLPVKTLELLNTDPQMTYSNLREKYSITKSTFYRWKRQSQEHRQKAATRFAAKHFLQSCFQEGATIPLQQFRQLFPEISRSTYYTWKHEMQSVISREGSSSSDANLSKDPQMYKPYTSPDGAAKSEGGQGSKNFLNHTKNGTSMQGAKSYLEKCISMNSPVPYRNFKRKFPGISRSTYYNWRRKAIKGNQNFKIHQPLSVTQKPTRNISLSLKSGNLLNVKMVNGQHPGPQIFMGIKQSLYSWQKQTRGLARKRVCQWKMPFCKFRLRYPSISSTTYWFWKKTGLQETKKHCLPSTMGSQILQQMPTSSEITRKAELKFHSANPKEFAPVLVGDEQMPNYSAAIPGYQMSEKVNSSMFVMDVIATAQFKAQAKLFLQQRFESKTFPTYKEFRAHFPLTARSTYYMWKRALHDGFTLVDA
ncbi:vertnin [Erythrolamprus reginae]|uniref:vertnin n=1 Tax=Erythrolamprus reginae TaxID=121349 RepID=UPI00396CB8F2